MSESLDVQAGKELVDRSRSLYGTKMNSVLVTDDGTNEASIPGFPYRFRAEGDKILVSVDIFKSGYECQVCNGAGKIEVKHGREMVMVDCSACNGKGALLHLADESKTLPTTGVIVSVGDDIIRKQQIKKFLLWILPKFVGKRLSYLNERRFVPGARVLFGCYTGVMIPTKVAGIVFKIIRDIEVLCTIKGGESGAAFDFLVVDKEL